jgi:hypothetical protein
MKYSSYKIFYLTGFIILGIAFGTYAQDSQIRATAPGSVVVGQAFNYTISGDFSGNVILPELRGFRLAGGPSTFVSQQSSLINGRLETVKTVTYTYTFLAQEEGDWVIPPATITSGRKEIKTNEVSVKVVKSAQEVQANQDGTQSESVNKQESVFIRQIPTKTTIYQGEQIVLSTKIYTQEALNISSFKAPGFDGFWRQELEGDNSAQQEKIKGEEYLSQVFKRDLLTAQKSGVLNIEAADIECMVRKKVSRLSQDPFNDPFFNDSFFNHRYENVPQSFKTNSVSIIVKPLPPGAPAGFSGAVGSFNMKVSIDKEKLKVNDAISLKVHISGTGNLDLLKPLKIDFPPDLEVFDPKSVQNIKQTASGSSGSLDYEYVLIPRHAGNFRISPVLFSWFDPSEAKYKTNRSSEFNFIVEKAESEDASYINSPLSPGITNQSGKEVVTLGSDIRFIRITPPELEPIGVSVFGSFVFIASFAVPLFFLLALILFRKERIRRNADINAVRNRKARKLAEKRLKSASLLLKSDDNGFYDEILKALWGYLSDKLGVNVSELSREKIAFKLDQKNLESNVQQKLWILLDDCEMARYASGIGGDKQKIYEDAIELISVLQEKLN